MTTKVKRWLPGPDVDARYNITSQTRWRWQHNPKLNFPEPIHINGRPYWDEDLLEKFEQNIADETAA